MTEKQLEALEDLKVIGVYHDDFQSKKPAWFLFDLHKEGDKIKSVVAVDDVEIDLKNDIVFPDGFDEEFLKRPKTKKAKMETFTKMMELVFIECYKRDVNLEKKSSQPHTLSFKDRIDQVMNKHLFNFVVCDDTDESIALNKRMRAVYSSREISKKALE